LEPRMAAAIPFEPEIETLAESYIVEQKNRQAIELLKTAPATSDSAYSREALIAVAYARAGERAKATESLHRTGLKLQQGYSLPYETAVIYTSLNDHERALDMLQIAFDERESEIIYLNVSPLLAPIRSEQRFQKLLTQMNLR
jgi:tetratricopeptide (TPR) repeat protein